MNSDQLYKFKVIADTKSVTDAANILFMTQSGLSHSLTAMEEELGCKLFIREPHKKLALTREGHNLLEYANIVSDLMSQIDIKIKKRDYYNVSAVNVCSAFILKHFPKSDLKTVHLINVDDKDMPRMLQDGSLDIAICDDRFINTFSAEEKQISPFGKQIVCREQIGFFVTEQSWLYNRDSVTFEELADEPICMQTNANALYAWLKEIKEISDKELNIFFTIDSYSYDLMRDYIDYPLVVILNSVFDVNENGKNMNQRKFVRLQGPYTERIMYMWYLKRMEEEVRPFINSLHKNYLKEFEPVNHKTSSSHIL